MAHLTEKEPGGKNAPLPRHEQPSPGGRRISPGRRCVFALVAVVLGLALAEGAARLAFPHRESIRALLGLPTVPLDLDPYEMPDGDHPGNWVLRPKYHADSVKELIAAKRLAGKFLGAEYLDERSRALGVSPDAPAFSVNSDGYKGPEIDKTHSRTRILTVGDSCTFGTWLDPYCYPRVMEKELRHAGRDVEVINAGVEGYAPRNVLCRIDKLKALAPDVTTVYIGWNAIYQEGFYQDRLRLTSLLRSVGNYLRTLGTTAQARAQKAYVKPLHPDENAPGVAAQNHYTPTFLPDLERVIREIQQTGGKVVLCTLPGLFATDEKPTPAALQKGHLPGWTDNPYVLAKRTQRYNACLRRMAEKLGLTLVDLDAWAHTELQPRDAFFADSVHLYEEGQAKIGEYLAAQVLPLLPESASQPEPVR